MAVVAIAAVFKALAQLSNDTVIAAEIVARATTVGRRSTWLETSYRERDDRPSLEFPEFLSVLGQTTAHQVQDDEQQDRSERDDAKHV